MADPRPENPWLRWGLMAAVIVATAVWWWVDPTPGMGPTTSDTSDARAPSPPSGVDGEEAPKKPQSSVDEGSTARGGDRVDTAKKRSEPKARLESEPKPPEPKPKPEPSVTAPPTNVPSPPANAARPDSATDTAGSKPSQKGTSARGPPSSKDGLKTVLKGVRVLNYGKVFYSGEMDLGPTIARIRRGERHSHRNDGSVFKNRERRLPSKRRGYYREFVHPTRGLRGPGPQRLVVGAQGEWYYTPDHYESFIPLGTASWRLPQRRR